jgi:hypothetical protein
MTVDTQAQSKVSPEEAKKPIFSKEERREIVSSFCKSYLSGKLKIQAWTPGVVVKMATGKETSREELLQHKRIFLKDLGVACGMENATQTDIDQSVEEIFAWLLAWRGSGLIDGEFSTIDQDARLKSLEVRYGSLEKLMLQLIEEVRMLSHVRGSNPP